MKTIPRIKRRVRKVRIRTSKTEEKKRLEKKKPNSQRREIVTADGLMNEVAAAKYIGKAESTLQNWRSLRKEIPKPTYRGRFVFYAKSTLDQYLNDVKSR